MKHISSIKLKFHHSSKNNALVSFVSYNELSKRYRGVNETAKCGKKVVVLHETLKGSVTAGVLYDCSIVPMSNGNGYIVVRATLQQYKATIATRYIKNNTYTIEITFGYKTLVFNPFSSGRSSKYDIEQFRQLLLQRADIADIAQVSKDFEESAKVLLRLMQQDRHTALHAYNRAVKRY